MKKVVIMPMLKDSHASRCKKLLSDNFEDVLVLSETERIGQEIDLYITTHNDIGNHPNSNSMTITYVCLEQMIKKGIDPFKFQGPINEFYNIVFLDKTIHFISEEDEKMYENIAKKMGATVVKRINNEVDFLFTSDPNTKAPYQKPLILCKYIADLSQGTRTSVKNYEVGKKKQVSSKAQIKNMTPVAAKSRRCLDLVKSNDNTQEIFKFLHKSKQELKVVPQSQIPSARIKSISKHKDVEIIEKPKSKPKLSRTQNTLQPFEIDATPLGSQLSQSQKHEEPQHDSQANIDSQVGSQFSENDDSVDLDDLEHIRKMPNYIAPSPPFLSPASPKFHEIVTYLHKTKPSSNQDRKILDKITFEELNQFSQLSVCDGENDESHYDVGFEADSQYKAPSPRLNQCYEDEELIELLGMTHED